MNDLTFLENQKSYGHSVSLLKIRLIRQVKNKLKDGRVEEYS